MKLKSYRDEEDMFQRMKGVIYLLPYIYIYIAISINV